MGKTLLQKGISALQNEEPQVPLHLYAFDEDNLHFLYSPALLLVGCGKTAEAAKESFDIQLAEFFRFTQENGTLEETLLETGWKVRRLKSGTKWITPSIPLLIRSNDQFADLLENKNYQHYTRTVTFPGG